MANYKTRNTGTGNGMRGNAGNVHKDSGESRRRFLEDSGECSRRFREMLVKIPGNVEEDSGECWQRFSGMLKKIGRFIMQLIENRIKAYILTYNQKCAQKRLHGELHGDSNTCVFL